jgi:hypothetical protein
MKIRARNTQKISFVKISGFSLNLWNREKDSFLSVYCLFELINFKNLLNTKDNISKWENGHLKRKVPQPLRMLWDINLSYIKGYVI